MTIRLRSRGEDQAEMWVPPSRPWRSRPGTAIAANGDMKSMDTSVKLLGIGSVVFGAWGLIHPKSLTDLLGDDPRMGRPLGVRDAVVGVALLASGGPVSLGMRFASDLHDTIRLRQRSPMVAMGAAAIAIWGAATLAASLAAASREDYSGTALA